MGTLVNQKSERDYQDFLISQIDELSVIVNGLDNYAPFNKLIEKWKKTNEAIDSSWHLFTDLNKLNEARITKFAAMELINCIESLKSDLNKAQTELVKLQNPDEFINKDSE